MAKITKGRIYAPADDASKPMDRDVIYPETNVESVISRTDGTTLKNDLGPKIVVGTSTGTDAPSQSGRDAFLVKKVGGQVSTIEIS